MKKSQRIRVRILLYIAIGNCALFLIYFIFLGYQLFVNAKSDSWAILFVFFFLMPFFLHAAYITYFTREYYPASEISRTHRIWFKIIVVFVILILALVILGLIGIAISMNEKTRLSQNLKDPIAKTILLTLFVLFLSQAYMLFEGDWLVKKIQKNHRSSLINSL